MTHILRRRELLLAAIAAASVATAHAQADKPVRIGFSMARTGIMALQAVASARTPRCRRSASLGMTSSDVILQHVELSRLVDL